MIAAPSRRADVLAALRSAEVPYTIAALAEHLGVHPNTVRYHLEALVETGQVQRVEPMQSKPGRPPQLFRAAPGMDPAGPRRYLLLAEILAGELAHDKDSRSRAMEAGRAWGARLAQSRTSAAQHEPVGRLVELLAELGFAPEHHSDGGQVQIGLRNCPFLDVAASSPQVVCPLHLGLMQGAVAAWNAPLRVDSLTPFVRPDRCLAQLTALPRKQT